MFEQEIWKDIKGYEELYQVSNMGRIKSLKRKAKNKNGYRITNEKIIKPVLTSTCKYYTVGLCKNKKRKILLVHRLVAQAFIPNPNNYKEVNHKDENKQNNNVNNLEWCNHQYNMHYGKCLKMISINQHRKKINQYDLEGNFIKQWESVSDIKKELNITNIASCCKGRYKQCNGYIWKYVNDNN